MTTRARLSAAARRALEVVLAPAAAELSSGFADRALTLHMLEGHAPRFFAEHRLAEQLQLAMASLGHVPTTFDAALPWDEVMARVDALYLRHIRGLPVPRFNRRRLAEKVAQVFDEGHLVLGWLLQQLAAPLGVEVSRQLPMRYPARLFDIEQHLYQLTHEVLLETRYLQTRAPRRALRATLDALEANLSDVLEAGWLDLAGEVVFSLQAGGRRVPGRALEALEGDPPPLADPREALHQQATRLIALAGSGNHR